MTVKKFRELCKTEEIFNELAEHEELRRENDVLGMVLMSLHQLGYTKKEINRVLARVQRAYETHTGDQAVAYWRENGAGGAEG